MAKLDRTFQLAKVIFEARKMEAWGPKLGPQMIARIPFPTHMADERCAEHDLAIAEAKAALRFLGESTT